MQTNSIVTEDVINLSVSTLYGRKIDAEYIKLFSMKPQ